MQGLRPDARPMSPPPGQTMVCTTPWAFATRLEVIAIAKRDAGHRRALLPALPNPVDDSVVGQFIKEPQLSTTAKVAAPDDSADASYGRPSATSFNRLLESAWGSGVAGLPAVASAEAGPAFASRSVENREREGYGESRRSAR